MNKAVRDRRIYAFLQARMNSHRLPGKALEQIQDISILEIMFKRLSQMSSVHGVALATTTSRADDVLCQVADSNGIPYFRGASDDVVARLTNAARQFSCSDIVRVTADCPLFDATLADAMVYLHLALDVDITLNYMPATLPDGLDIAVLKRTALERLAALPLSSFDKEHVTTFVEKNATDWSIACVTQQPSLSHQRWTLDNEDDLRFLRALADEASQPMHELTFPETLRLLRENPELENFQSKSPRNYGHEENAN